MARPLPSWMSSAALPWVAEEASVFGQGPLIVADAAAGEPLTACAAELHNAIVVGVDEAGALPPVADVFDILLTTASAPPRPWVEVKSIDETVAALSTAVTSNPHAAVTLAQVLRAQHAVSFEKALQ